MELGSYTITLHERDGEPDARYVYEETAPEAMTAIRSAITKAAEDYCLNEDDLVVIEAALD